MWVMGIGSLRAANGGLEQKFIEGRARVKVGWRGCVFDRRTEEVIHLTDFEVRFSDIQLKAAAK